MIEKVRNIFMNQELYGVAIGGALTFLFGPITTKLLALLVVIVVDTILGTQRAIIEKEFSFSYLLKHVTYKLYFYSLYMILFNMVDHVINLQHTARALGIVGMVIVEFSSIWKHTLKLERNELVIISKYIISRFKDIDGMAEKLSEASNSNQNEGDNIDRV